MMSFSGFQMISLRAPCKSRSKYSAPRRSCLCLAPPPKYAPRAPHPPAQACCCCRRSLKRACA
eukprot:12364388-Alexandrium_andersonii.AAC.1